MFIHNLLYGCMFAKREASFFLVYVNSSHLTTHVEYFAIIGSRLIAECFAIIFQYNLTAADIKKFRFSAYSRDRLIGD